MKEKCKWYNNIDLSDKKRTLVLKVLCMNEEIKKHGKILRGDVGSKSCLSLRNKIERKEQPLMPAREWARDTDRAASFFSYQ